MELTKEGWIIISVILVIGFLLGFATFKFTDEVLVCKNYSTEINNLTLNYNSILINYTEQLSLLNSSTIKYDDLKLRYDKLQSKYSLGSVMKISADKIGDEYTTGLIRQIKNCEARIEKLYLQNNSKVCEDREDLLRNCRIKVNTTINYLKYGELK